jgi:hypothetical protein
MARRGRLLPDLGISASALIASSSCKFDHDLAWPT